MLDVISSSHMTQGSSTNFAMDRFGNLNSALALNGGWTQVPSGVYFDSPEFTISVWVYPQSVGKCARILDFSNSNANVFTNNIYIRLDNQCYQAQYQYAPELAIYSISSSSQPQVNCISSQMLSLSQWQFLAATYDGNTMNLYINGVEMCSQTKSFNLMSMARSFNYIGKSFDSYDGYSQSILDDLRFYNKSLTQTQILGLMNQNQSGNFIMYCFFLNVLVGST